MSTVEQRGHVSHHTHVRSRLAAEGVAPAVKRLAAAGSFSDAALAAVQRLSGRQQGQGTVGIAPPQPAVDIPPAGAASPAHDAATLAAASAGGRDVTAAYGHYIGRSLGSGQCVALVTALNPGIGSTAHWVCGEAVRGNTGLQPGTVIATFDRSGRYANATDGSSHAAVYLGQNERGIQVLDQWSGRPAGLRTIRWTNPGGAAADTGTAFRVVDAGQRTVAQSGDGPTAKGQVRT